MQSTRLTTRLPRTIRVIKTPITPTRNMSLFPRFVSHDFPRFVASDLAPVWRLLDDYANQTVSVRNSDACQQRRTFNPRFDVREVESAYELKGELPGVDQKDIEVEFPDAQTIVIKGSTGYSRQEATPQTTEQEPEVGSAPSEKSHQPTVEDEAEESASNTETGDEWVDAGEPTSASTSATQVQEPVRSQATESTGRYWVSERFTGQFQRVFSFPAPVDTDNVKAKLSNGVLDVTIPKVQKAGIKRIAIE